MTRLHPEWRDDRDAQLHGSLVRYTRLIGEVRWPSPSVRFSFSWYSSRRRAYETISICSLHSAPISFEAYFASSNRVGSSTVPKQTETPRGRLCAYRLSRCSMGTSRGRTQDGLGYIRRIDRKTGELRGSVLQGVGDAGEKGVVGTDVKRAGWPLRWLLRDQEGVTSE